MAVVTGGAGFIGSYLVDGLVRLYSGIVVIDNLSSGSIENLRRHLDKPYFRLVRADLKKPDKSWTAAFKEADVVFHFAANPEVRVSVTDPRVHFEENVVATFNVLETCRRHDVPLVVFASTSTVYGDARVIPTPEDYWPLEPGRLEILGDGTQRKSYLHVHDAVDATLHLYRVFRNSSREYDVYNVGSEDWITVREIADIVVQEMGLRNVEYIYKPATPDGRGWLGDVKFMLLDISKLKSTGWRPQWSSRQAVRKAVHQLLGKE